MIQQLMGTSCIQTFFCAHPAQTGLVGIVRKCTFLHACHSPAPWHG
jgi:hypothetical protein